MDSIGQKMENKVRTRADVTATVFFIWANFFSFFPATVDGTTDRPTGCSCLPQGKKKG